MQFFIKLFRQVFGFGGSKRIEIKHNKAIKTIIFCYANYGLHRSVWLASISSTRIKTYYKQSL